MNKIILNCFIISCILIGSCSSKKRVASVVNSKEAFPSAEGQQKKLDELKQQLNLYQQSNFSFTFLSMKQKVQVTTADGKDFNLTFNYRMEQGKRIWISISALGGIEVSRVLMDKDSIKILDRLNNKYIKNNFTYVSDLLGTLVDFNTVEALLVNNFITPTSLNTVIISGKENNTSLINWNENGVDEQIELNNSNNKIRSIYINDTLEKRTLTIKYDGYQTIDTSNFPQRLFLVALTGDKKFTASTELVKIQREVTLEFPFSIPKKFN